MTYVVQRVESLMGMFFLLTFYCFARSLTARHPGRWQVATVLCCLVGMATKEVMVVAPVLVLLYDRAFVGGSLLDAWRRRRRLYAGLAATWILLAFLLVGIGGSRQNAAGFTGSISPAQYWWTQAGAITRYLRLALWPRPWCSTMVPCSRTARRPPGAVPCWWRCWRRSSFSAPGGARPSDSSGSGSSSSWRPPPLVPVATQTIAEHRMYLPLAAVAAGFVLGVFALLRTGPARLLVLVPAVVALGVTTARRNLVYGSEVSLWRDTVARCPDNARAHCSYALALAADPRK